ncbi:MAG: response regulator, partial [Alphaproteobacteria bacterium]|nr:response regulator [Alphaproteobacteria bacterium]
PDSDALPDRPPAPSVEEAAAAGALILVAEDNPVNQQVILRQLARLGFAAELAGDGAEALELWKTGRHALLLTDCQMPEMDGFALAAAVREAERGGDRRTPIVALTANALRGEAERCLAVGMDDYLSKPVELATLRRVVLRWLPESTPGPALRDGPLHDAFADDPAMLRTLFDEFLRGTRALLDGLAEASRRGDPQAAHGIAREIADSAATVGAVRLLAAARDFGDMNHSPRALARMEESFGEIDSRVTPP